MNEIQHEEVVIRTDVKAGDGGGALGSGSAISVPNGQIGSGSVVSNGQFGSGG